MSIWGRRIDAWITRGRPPATREDYNRAGLNSLWQLVLVALVVALALYVGSRF